MLIDEAAILWEKFRISEEFGFLEPNPLTELPEKYRPWMDCCDKMVSLISSGSVREVVNTVPELDVNDLQTHAELRLAHLLLATMTSGYVWGLGPDKAPSVLPRCLAIPFHSVSKRLDMPPVVSHATVCIANWKRIDENLNFHAENLKVIAFKFMPIRGNDWFFVNTAQIEKDMAPAIYRIASCTFMSSIRCQNAPILNKQIDLALEEIQISLTKAISTFKRMRDHLEPADFFHKVRPFLWGYNEGTIKESGIIFEGLEHLGAQKYPGGSAAQSSTIQVLDAFLGVDHQGKNREFLVDQRQYMPKPHRELIDFVAENRPKFHNSELYNGTVEALRSFRSQHLQVVSLFILTQRPHTAEATGTGGTSFVTFLKDLRNDCDVSNRN